MLQPMLERAGATSFTAFSRDARAVGIGRDDAGGYYITPTRNPNRSRGNSFLDLVEKELTVPSGASDRDLGIAVREGLARSVIGSE